MSSVFNSVKAKAYRDNNNTALIKDGVGISVSEGSSGDYTINSSVSKIVAFQTTTNGSGVVTVDLTSYSFSSTPRVGLTCQQTSATQFTGALVTSVSSTSLSIKTYQTQSTLISILGLTVNPVVVVSAVVDVILIEP